MASSHSAMGSRGSPLGTHCYQSFDGSVMLSSATYPINDATDETLTPTSKLHFALLILLSHKKASKIMGQPLLDSDLNGKESGKLYFIVTYTGFLHIYEYDGGIISGMGAPPRPAKKGLPRSAPPRKKASLAPPRPAPQKLAKPAGRGGAKFI